MKKWNPLVEQINGLLLVDKPGGLTSHDVVDKVRRHFQLKKVGHAGTLDPMATGLLVLALGKGTKLSGLLISENKQYHATCLLGEETDTQDRTGKCIQKVSTGSITPEQIKKVVQGFIGPQEQIPPMFSAKKKEGRKLYELARKGIEVEREPKSITVYELNILSMNLPKFEFSVTCSKGTYVRTLCHDIGKKLGCGGILFELRRIRSGDLGLENAVSLEELLKLNPVDLLEKLIPLEEIKSYANC